MPSRESELLPHNSGKASEKCCPLGPQTNPLAVCPQQALWLVPQTTLYWGFSLGTIIFMVFHKAMKYLFIIIYNLYTLNNCVF